MRISIAVATALVTVALYGQTSLVDQGRAAINRNDVDAAIGILEKAVEQSPNSAEAHYLLGSAYGIKAQRGSMFSAAMTAGKMKDEFVKAVDLNPNLIEARMALLQFYAAAPGFMGGDFDKALAQAAEVKKRDAVQGHRAYAIVYAAQKKPDLARKEYLDAIHEQPASAKAHNYYGQYLVLSEKNFKAAFEEFENAVKLDAAYMPPWYWIGRVAGDSGENLARGEESIKKYLATTPKEGEPPLANAHYWLGMIYEKQGHKAEAKQQYEAALKLNSELKMASEALKRVS